MVMEEGLSVGNRISVDDYIGTIKFIGLVPPTKGEWVGVEWDDPSRGKHNGSKDDVVYFTCRSPTGGSFIRPHKVSAGISIFKALMERYSGYSCEEGQELYLEDPGTAQKTMIETIGMDKVQKQFEDLYNLRVAGLRLQNISSLGSESDALSKHAPNLEEMDLSKNLISNWETVGAVCSQLQKMTILNLSGNIMRIPKSPDQFMDQFSSLRTIILNSCSLDWDEVVSCSTMWPQIVELHLECNEITSITTPPEHVFGKLEVLNLTGNGIKEWKHILSLSKLPSLERLLLNGCSLSKISLCPDDFPSLVHISLSNNAYDSVKVFNQLNCLSKLESFTFKRNPVFTTENEDTMRGIVIAKIRQLKKLNKSVIDDIERQGSEMDYLKQFGAYWRESGGHQDPKLNNPSQKFLEDHPRYMELVEIHGARADIEFYKKSTALKGSLLDINFVVMHKSDMKPFRKKLPTSMTVGSLKLLVSRLTKTPIQELTLKYVCSYDTNHIVSMEKDSETLHFISLESGDTVQVHPRFID